MRDRARDRREGSRGMKKRCKPGWKIRGKRREGRQNRAEGRKALEDGGLPVLSGTSPWEG